MALSFQLVLTFSLQLRQLVHHHLFQLYNELPCWVLQADLTAYLGGIVSQQYNRTNTASQLYLCFQTACIFSKLVSTVNAAPQPLSVA